MHTPTSKLFAAWIGLASLIALPACGAPVDATSTEDETSENRVRHDDLADDLVLACMSRTNVASTFELLGFTTESRTAKVEGLLRMRDQTTPFACQPAAPGTVLDRRTMSDLIATCTERGPRQHAGAYSITVSREDGVLRAALITESGEEKFSCERPSAAQPPEGKIVTFDDAVPVLAGSCGRCHNGQWRTLAAVRQDRDRMVMMIESGLMPRGADPSWRQEGIGRELLDYLKNSPELADDVAK